MPSMMAWMESSFGFGNRKYMYGGQGYLHVHVDLYVATCTKYYIHKVRLGSFFIQVFTIPCY